MSAAGQIKDLVEAAVAALTGRTDERLDRVEERVSELEDRVLELENANKPPAARKAPRPAVKAHAATAEVKGEATGPGGA